MSRRPRRALLIGVSDYDDRAIESLPFIADDLDDLDKALTEVGYEVVRHPPEHGDRDRIDTAIEQFCRRAAPGQQLLIFLSGHGIHHDGRDYLLPSSADTDSRKFIERCLEIDFTGHIEDSRCGDVLVVIDACREGVRLREKSGYGYVHEWTRQQRDRSAARTVAYLYACSSGELARWRETADGTFSLFTRAFSRALTDASVPGTLTDVREAVRVRLEDFSAQLGVPLQKPYLDGDHDRNAELRLVDRLVGATTSRGPRGWAENAKDHAVWDLVRSPAGSTTLPGPVAALHQATVDCVEAWSREYERLRRSLDDDPWWDDELATRMHDRLSWIVKHVLNPAKLAEGDRPPLSPAEAALLVLVPFAQQLHRASGAVASRAALDATQATDDGDEFARYVEGRRRIQRRLRRLEASGDQANAAAVRWAAYHRWLAQRPQLYRDQVVTSSLLTPLARPDGPAATLLRDVISAERLARLLRALRSDPEATGAGEPTTDALNVSDIPAGAQTIAGGSPDEQTVRDRLLALILLVAEEFTIDATALPSIVTDHVGLHDGVEPGEVLTTVKRARWSARGRTRVLEADCPHQSVQLALAEHTHGIAEVLRRVDVAAEADRTLEALRDLPTHVAADGLRPLSQPDGSPRYDLVGFRFRLDDDRVQELLMGEQLYGDPALAIRELYQNALDACRYRRARTEYLRKRNRWTPEWTGQITFTQGVDEHGRAWLECRDNGIGMSERELSSVFSHAGARFADLPEFLEEQAAWDKEGIEFHPNSRFGIGVLSYFMLGDEIEVSTARFTREGDVAGRLRVDIDGPGSLCRIRTVSDGPDSGTTIRIYLRPGLSVSGTQVLSRLLWVAEFPVSAADGGATLAWAPGQLSKYVTVGHEELESPDEDLSDENLARLADQALPSSTSNVWWCAVQGGILADGLWAGESIFGYVVNLVGSMAPKLSVDRRRILRLDQERIRELLRTGLPDLFAEGSNLPSLSWLGTMAVQDLDLADEIADEMMTRHVELTTSGGITVRTALVGVFPPDEMLFTPGGSARYARAGEDLSRRDSRLPVARWRLYRHLQAGAVPALRLTSEQSDAALARPSDAFLLSITASGNSPWLDISETISIGYVLRISARLGRRPLRVAQRLIELGFNVADFAWPDVQVTSNDELLLSAGLDGQAPWLGAREPVSSPHVAAASAILGWPTKWVVERLNRLGRTVAGPVSTYTTADTEINRILLSRYLTGDSPWWDRSDVVPGQQVMVAAATVSWTPGRVAGRLAELGVSVPDADWPQTLISDEDHALLQVHGHPAGFLLFPGSAVPAGHIVSAALKLGWSPRQVATRLTQLGLQVADIGWLETLIAEEGLESVARIFDSFDMRLEPSEPVSVPQVLTAAYKMGETPQKVAAWLSQIGLSVTDFAWPDVLLVEEDLDLLQHVVWPRGRDSPPLPLPVPVGYLTVTAAALDWPVSRVTDRLNRLGIATADVGPITPMTGDDLRLLSVNPRTRRLHPVDEVPTRHLIAASAQLRWSTRRVVERLKELGLRVPDREWPDIVITGDDHELLSRGLDRARPRLDPPPPVKLGSIYAAAAALRWPLSRVAERLVELGLEVLDSTWPDVRVANDDKVLYSRLVTTENTHITTREQAVDPAILLPGINTSGWSAGSAALRLSELGLTLPAEIELVPDELPKATLPGPWVD